MYKFTVAWSWSRLSDFEKCALMAYWKHYAPKALRCKFIDSPPLIRGRKVHKDLEMAVGGKPLPADLAHVQHIVDGVRRAIGEGWLIDPEIQLTFNVDYSPGDWFNTRNTFLRSGLDLLMRRGKNAKVWDWKTGKISPVSDQLKLYAMVTMTRYPEIDYVATAFIWVDHKSSTREEYDRWELPEIVEEFEERVNMIQIASDDANWIPNPSDFNCKWCPCTKAQCPHSRN